MAKKKQKEDLSMQDVRDKVEAEGGLEYAFVYYSSFDEVEDAEFHALRKAFVEAHKKLNDYINARSVGE